MLWIPGRHWEVSWVEAQELCVYKLGPLEASNDTMSPAPCSFHDWGKFLRPRKAIAFLEADSKLLANSLADFQHRALFTQIWLSKRGVEKNMTGLKPTSQLYRVFLRFPAGLRGTEKARHFSHCTWPSPAWKTCMALSDTTLHRFTEKPASRDSDRVSN